MAGSILMLIAIHASSGGAAANVAEPARARVNLPSLVAVSDYPATALRNREEGTVRFRLTVSPEGRVSNCVVTASSGSSALDAASCRIMRSRARFTPARDSSGALAADTFNSQLTWRLTQPPAE